MTRRAAWATLLGIALAAGALVAWIDTRPGRDDPGVTAGRLFLAAGVLGISWPRRAWVWALAVGGWIPARSIARHHSYAMLLALLITLTGAYLGVAARRALFPPSA